MATLQSMIDKKNESVKNSYLASITKIEKIQQDLAEKDDMFSQYFKKTIERILKCNSLEKNLNDEYFKSHTLEELKEQNHSLFSEILDDNYNTCYSNPSYTAELFGKELGPVLASFYASIFKYTSYAFTHKTYLMESWNQSFIEVYDAINADKKDKLTLTSLVSKVDRDVNEEEMTMNVLRRFDVDSSIHTSIVMDSDLTDQKYLYRYGEYICDNEIKLSSFIQKFTQDKIDTLSKSMANAYVRGFELGRKDMKKKKSVAIYYYIGQERLVKSLVKEFEAVGLKSILSYADGTKPNRQYDYDYRFSHALFFNKEYSDQTYNTFNKVSSDNKQLLNEFSGAFFFDSFGESPFSPESKPLALKFDDQQQKLFSEHSSKMRETQNKYIPRTETSFGIIAFPTPEIGKDFENIFEETSNINMLDTEHYEKIQHNIVNVLDKADFVHVKGKNNNKTDIMVKMPKIDDPKTQTNFVNCGADVNIPVGEVFTTPQLKKTNGTLHINETYLDGLNYKDLIFTIKDGYVTDFNCSNFDNEEEGKKYIQENLFFPHKTLPIGEFAIGTNTLAYVMAQKYNLLSILPILIVEKMGPHFAFGDTCFSWEEDWKVYNPIDNKEIVARDNEKTLLRKTDLQKAYTQCHTDITLPYEDLDFISVVTTDETRVDIIKDGRFAVPGTEELNIPLDKYFGE
ncbi:MAG: aminopeptidase [Bacteriovoracaceae bacterium]|nr:aminopeptidase [Bacteriovoracaceae bacterium]